MLNITGEDLENYVARIEITILGDYARGYNREIKFNPAAGYRVYNYDGLVLTTPDAEKAAAEFNALRPR